jgi:hypothetical protein
LNTTPSTSARRVVKTLSSGTVTSLSPLGLASEPTVSEKTLSVDHGVAAVR